MSQPVVEGSLGSPPFEKPNIEQVTLEKKTKKAPQQQQHGFTGHQTSAFSFIFKGVLNFVQYKFSHLAPKERQTMFELSKMFLLCLNYWKLETPTQYRQRTQKEDGTAYKVDYTRCVCGAQHVNVHCSGSPSWLEQDLVFNKVLLSCSSHAVLVTGSLFPVFPSPQVAVLLPRPPEQRQPAALRNHPSVRPQFAQVHFHRDAAAAPREVQGGKGQAAAGETHPHPHAFPQVRGNRPGFTSKKRLDFKNFCVCVFFTWLLGDGPMLLV